MEQALVQQVHEERTFFLSHYVFKYITDPDKLIKTEQITKQKLINLILWLLADVTISHF